MAGMLLGGFAGFGIMTELHQHGWRNFASDWGLLILIGCHLIGMGVQAFF